MIDNSRLSDFVKKNLRHLSYEYKINIYDRNCSDCSFKKILVVGDRYGEHEMNTMAEAIDKCLFNNKLSILRMCQYGGDEYSLDEIACNTCRLWDEETIESGENSSELFMEIIVEDRNLREISSCEVVPQPTTTG